MVAVLSLTEAQILTVLRAFLLDVLPAGTPVVKGQINRVPEVIETEFVVMTPLLRPRISTNVDDYDDASFVGSISGTVLSVDSIEYGSIVIGAPVYGSGVAAGTRVTAFLSGSGGVGTYTVTPSQFAPAAVNLLTAEGLPLLTAGGQPILIAASGTMAAGVLKSLQPTMVAVQLDVHGAASADNVQIITTLFRDEYACVFFTDMLPELQPLYTSEPRQAPFINGEAQVEYRWTVDAVMQANPIVTVPQQFADGVTIALEPVT